MAMIAFILTRLIDLFMIVLLVWIVMGWLIAFGVITYRNPLVGNVMQFCNALIEPVLNPIRKFIPAIGGLDISPIILIIGLQAVQIYILTPLADS